jgi:hypothetical protein
MNLLEIQQLLSSSLEPSSDINLVKTTLESHSHEIPQKTVTSKSPSKQMLQNSHMRITLKTKVAKHIMSESHSKQLLQNTITSGITFKNATKHNWEREALSRRLNLSYVHGRTDCPRRCHHHLLDQSQLQSRSMHYAEALLEHHSLVPEQPGTIIKIRNSVFLAFHQFYCIIPHDWPQGGEKKTQEKHKAQTFCEHCQSQSCEGLASKFLPRRTEGLHRRASFLRRSFPSPNAPQP